MVNMHFCVCHSRQVCVIERLYNLSIISFNKENKLGAGESVSQIKQIKPNVTNQKRYHLHSRCHGDYACLYQLYIHKSAAYVTCQLAFNTEVIVEWQVIWVCQQYSFNLSAPTCLPRTLDWIRFVFQIQVSWLSLNISLSAAPSPRKKADPVQLLSAIPRLGGWRHSAAIFVDSATFPLPLWRKLTAFLR